jgi:hypothetical protein
MAESVGKDTSHKGTNQFMRQGHTSGAYGNASKEASGAAGAAAKEQTPK